MSDGNECLETEKVEQSEGDWKGEGGGGRLIIKKGIFPVFLPISLIILACSNINSAVLWLPLETKLSKST